MSDKFAIQFRANPDLRKRLQDHRRSLPEIPPLAELVRRFVERGLDAEADEGAAGDTKPSPAGVT
jgi:hypothetical protein